MPHHGSPPISAVGQTSDAANSKTIASADAQPSTPWVGGWTATRGLGVVRQLVVISASDTSIGGTFTFEYSEDADTATISESRVISDFTTVRDFDLLNSGAYFRVQFEPTDSLGSETVTVTTTQRRQNDGAFVRLAGQQIEEDNAAMPQSFAYLKAFVETTGKSTNVRATDRGFLIIGDFLTEVARGSVTGHSIVHVSGRNPAVAASTEELLWFASSSYTGWLTAASAVRIKAGGNANDTAAGTGAQSVLITGLDASFAEVSDTVATAGGSASAATTQTFIRLISAEVVNVGSYSSPYNAGDVEIETTGGVLLGNIEAERGNSQIAAYTVPASKAAYLTHASTNVDGSKSSDVFLYVREDADDVSTPFTGRNLFWQFAQVSGQASRGFQSPLGPIPAKTDIWMSAVGPSGGAGIGGSFSLLLVDD